MAETNTQNEEYKRVHSFRGLLNRHFWKFFIVMLLMIAGGFLVAYTTNYYGEYKRWRAAEDARQEAAVKAEAAKQ